MKLKKAGFTLALFLAPFMLWAQQAVNSDVEMADAMR